MKTRSAIIVIVFSLGMLAGCSNNRVMTEAGVSHTEVLRALEVTIGSNLSQEKTKNEKCDSILKANSTYKKRGIENPSESSSELTEILEEYSQDCLLVAELMNRSEANQRLIHLHAKIQFMNLYEKESLQ